MNSTAWKATFHPSAQTRQYILTNLKGPSRTFQNSKGASFEIDGREKGFLEKQECRDVRQNIIPMFIIAESRKKGSSGRAAAPPSGSKRAGASGRSSGAPATQNRRRKAMIEEG